MRLADVSAPARDAFTAFRERILLDEKGHLTLEGVRTLIIPVAILQNIQETGEQILGGGWPGVIYLAGEANGREIVEIVRKRMKDAPPERLFQVIAERTELRGLGRVVTSALDLRAGSGTVTMEASPLAEPPGAGTPRCFLAAGLWAGVVATISRREVTARETKCRASGALQCEFTLEPHGA